MNNTNFNIPSVNFHLWQPCNMRCKFCFATFQEVKNTILPKGHLPKKDAVSLVEQVSNFGFSKITFVGGEPTLCPWLSDLIAVAKEKGLTTMLVSNGTHLSKEFLTKVKNSLDWVTLSIDSLSVHTNLKVGRAIAGRRSIPKSKYMETITLLRKMNFKLKINTVVNRTNLQENLSELIHYARPSRWKIFQVLPIKGENDVHIDNLKVSLAEFQKFVTRHSALHRVTNIVPESNEAMTSSYIMIDPAGRFFDNSLGRLHYSQPILTVGVKTALSQVKVDGQKFISRNGLYDWS